MTSLSSYQKLQDVEQKVIILDFFLVCVCVGGG